MLGGGSATSPATRLLIFLDSLTSPVRVLGMAQTQTTSLPLHFVKFDYNYMGPNWDTNQVAYEFRKVVDGGTVEFSIHRLATERTWTMVTTARKLTPEPGYASKTTVISQDVRKVPTLKLGKALAEATVGWLELQVLWASLR